MTGLIRYFSRRRLVRKTVPEHWIPILEHRVPFFKRLQGAARERFLAMLKIFVWEKVFIGAGGMQITDEVKVVISACAVRLVFYLDLSYYDRLTEIIVYPYVYRHEGEGMAILGEAQDWGTVVLSWPTVLQDLMDPRDGHETALHEFAHVLDRIDGEFNGTPPLKALEDYRPWARVMSSHYLRLRAGDSKERKVLRSYGATNEAEFFAVATESYFEKPQLMKRILPDLYAELQTFYGGDPASQTAPDHQGQSLGQKGR